MIARTALLAEIRRALGRSRVVALVGPRQSGKTTLARQILPATATAYLDLEEPGSVARLSEPMTALGPLEGIVVIDEIQRRPDLFPVLRVLADRKPGRARFLVLGRASPAMLRQSSESLAGRIEIIQVSGFSMQEVGANHLARHWLRGGFPRAYLARSATDSLIWRRQFISTFLERDMPQLGVKIPAPVLLRFWTMLAHYHGQIWNAAEPARSLGVSEPTVRHYLDLLTGVFMVRQLAPWHENLKKRQVRAPKIYLRDSGLLHALLGIESERDLLAHPKSGASWEGYALEETLKVAGHGNQYFWATHQGAELDLLLLQGGQRLGVEIKRADAPVLTPSLRIAMTDLRLDGMTVLYPGERRYELAANVSVVPLKALASEGIEALRPRRGARTAAKRKRS